MTRFPPIALAALALCVAPTVASAQTQAEMNRTAAEDARRADDALNAQYAATMSRLSLGSKTMLRDVQRAWIPYRDRQCRFETSAVRGGSAYPMVQSQCVARMTRERTRELRRLEQCPEGDLACPR